jgi:hypothetical protein
MSPPYNLVEKKDYTFETISSICLMLLIAVLILGLAVLQKQEAEPPKTTMDFLMEYRGISENNTCVGILDYYTATNFTSDARILIQKALDMTSHENNGITHNMTLLPPKAILEQQPYYDCEDTTHALLCLERLYPYVACQIYVMYRENGYHHIGVECKEGINGRVLDTYF